MPHPSQGIQIWTQVCLLPKPEPQAALTLAVNRPNLSFIEAVQFWLKSRGWFSYSVWVPWKRLWAKDNWRALAGWLGWSTIPCIKRLWVQFPSGHIPSLGVWSLVGVPMGQRIDGSQKKKEKRYLARHHISVQAKVGASQFCLPFSFLLSSQGTISIQKGSGKLIYTEVLIT